MTLRPLVLSAFLAATPVAAWAEAPVATSNGADAPMAASPATPGSVPLPQPADPDAPPKPDRAFHGEVGVAIGTGGYRSGYVILSAPIGDRGMVGIAASTTKSDRGLGYPGYGYGGYEHSNYRAGMAYGASLRPGNDRGSLRNLRPGETCVDVTRTDGAPLESTVAAGLDEPCADARRP